MSVIDYGRGTAPNAAAAPSPGVWARCPVLQLLTDPTVGWYHLEQWKNATHSYTSTTAANGYNSYFDGGTIATDATVDLTVAAAHGIIRPLALTTSGSGDEENAIQWLDQTSDAYIIAENQGEAWFECCIQVSSVADLSLQVGLMEEGAPANTLLADAGTGSTAQDFIGFSLLEATPTALNTAYATATTLTNKTTAVQTMAAASTDWYNVGLHFDGVKTLRWLVDGTLVDSIDITTSGFPDGEEMSPIWAVKDHTAAAKVLRIGWWRGAQLYEG